MSASPARAFDQLSENRLFEGIESGFLDKIAPNVHVVQLGAGEVIFREGDPGDVMYLVGKGSVKISNSCRGGEQETLGFIQAGNVFGERALLDGDPRSVMARALDSTLLGAVDEPPFLHILELEP